MAVDYSIDHERKLVVVRAHGVVVLTEILDFLDAVTVREAHSYSKLFDAREAVPRLSDDDMMVLGARVSAYAAFDPRGPVAAIATTAAASAVLQRYMNLGDADRPMRLFTSLEDARTWLDVVN